jgi:serine phosphatase RsbU (regulator of sigma subunit)
LTSCRRLFWLCRDGSSKFSMYGAVSGGSMRKLVVRAGMLVISVLVAILLVAALAQDYTRADTFIHMGDIWSMLSLEPDTLGFFTEVDRDDFVSPPFPERGDTLVSVAGLPATMGNYFTIFTTGTPEGMEVPLEFRHGGSLYSTTVRTRTIPLRYKLLVTPLLFLRFAITISLFAVGAWAFAKRPLSRAVRVLTVFCYAMSIGICYSYMTLPQVYARFHLPFEATLFAVLGIFGFMSAPLWLNLQYVFPREKPWYLRRRLLIDLATYLPPLLLTASLLLSRGKQDHLFGPLSAIYLITGCVMLIRSHGRAGDPVERRMVRLVLWGSLPAITMLLLLNLGTVFFSETWTAMPTVVRLAVTNALFLAVLLIPASFATAFGKYRLLEVEGRVRRGTLFVLVNVCLLALLLGLVYKAGGWLMALTDTGGPVPILVASIGLAVGFAPAQRVIRHYLEDRFFPERRRLRLLLKDFLSTTRDVSDRDEFWIMLRRSLSSGLHTSGIEPVLFQGADPGTEGTCDDGPAPFRRSDPLLQRLALEGKPMLVDEIVCCGRLGLESRQVEWFESRETVLLVPLAAHQGLLGFVAAGRKHGGEDYTPADLEILTSLSQQIGLAAENMELLEEKLEKERIQEQLQIARRIQRSLLPETIPSVPGLELSARIRFCLEVAGDFYDLITLPDGRLMLTVGDVSGKGVGPALLMANLQASIRAMSGTGIELAGLVTRLNRLVFEASPAEYFITLFAAVYDPPTRSLEWVNAGHNPPLLLGRRGRRLLDEGGLLLGVNVDAAYVSAGAVLEPGDLLLMYTDGVSEEWGPDGEEFGVDRIAACAGAGRLEPLGDLLDRLELEIREFSGRDTFADDLTLLAARPFPESP